MKLPKPPPTDIPAERALLGAMTLTVAACRAAAEAQLTGLDFYDHIHGAAFDLAMDLYSRGEPVDPVTIGEELRRRLSVLQLDTPTLRDAPKYAKRVEEHSLRRRLIAVAKEAKAKGYMLQTEVEDA